MPFSIQRTLIRWQNYIHLTKHERNEIQVLRNKGYSVREIARAIGRGKTTVSNELNRNAVSDEYLASKAQAKPSVVAERPVSKVRRLSVTPDYGSL